MIGMKVPEVVQVVAWRGQLCCRIVGWIGVWWSRGGGHLRDVLKRMEAMFGIDFAGVWICGMWGMCSRVGMYGEGFCGVWYDD